MTRPSGLAVVFVLMSSSAMLSAQTYRVLRSLEGLGSPSSPIFRGQDGYLYATVGSGGDANSGAIVKMSPGGSITGGKIAIVHSFLGGEGGVLPMGDLAGDASGNLYGTTYSGGTSSVGSVYRLAPDGTYSTLHSFSIGTDGGFPLGIPIRDGNDNLYGLTAAGGPSEEGTVFKVATDGTFSVLHAFSFTDGQGYRPSSLTSEPAGNLYGTTSSGGPLGGGVVFKLAPDGTYTLLHSFAGGSSDANGSAPFGLMRVAGEALLGLTMSGGGNHQGTLFKLASDGTFTVLHTFGSYPSGGLAQDGGGNLYGVTPQGGGSGGAVYRLAPDGTFNVLHSFAGGNDGLFPYQRLLLDASGNIYGSALSGGVGGYGTFFKLAPSGNPTVLRGLRLSAPNGGLDLDPRGNLFGTTQRGGGAIGSAFRLSTVDGSYAQLHAFSGPEEGSTPMAGLVRDSAGQLYGTTSSEGPFNVGALFRLGSDGTPTILHAFGSPGPDFDGATPLTGVVLDEFGNLYGTTQMGGAGGQGTVFSLSSDGSGYAILHDFGAAGFDDGAAPLGGLARDAAGNLYGTASVGGVNGAGVVFRLGAGPSFTVLHSFDGTDGAYPAGAPSLDASGTLYGTTLQGGSMSMGAVFKIAADGTFAVVHEFGGPDGAGPQGDIVLDSKGNLYGTTTNGGASNMGTMFKVASDGSYSVLHSFDGKDGSLPLGGLLLDGSSLYGTTSAGGRWGGGVVFQLELP